MRPAISLGICLVVVASASLPATEVTEAENPTAARFKLSEAQEAVGKAAVLIGVGVAATASTPIFVVSTAYEVIDTGLDVTLDSVAVKSNVAESGLLIINKEADALRQMHAEGRDLRTDPEARRLIDDLSGRLRTDKTWYGFAGRALGENGLYESAKYGAFHLLSHFLGPTLSRWLGLGDAIRLHWLRDGRLARGLTRTEWKRLKAAADASKKFADLLTDEAFKQLIPQAAHKLVGETLDHLVGDLELKEQERRRLSRGAQYNLVIVRRPEIALPAIAALVPAPAPAEPAPARAEPVLQLPERVIVARDVVVRAVAVQRQITQTYTVNTSEDTYRSDTVDHPMRVPDVDLSRFGSSFDGASGGTFWKRW